MVAATGLPLNLKFLESSWIAPGWEITVDEYLCTDLADIFTAGDFVEVPDLYTGETSVHAILLNAIEQGFVVGSIILGIGNRYEGAHRMNSVKYLDLPIMAGGLNPGDQVLQASRDGSLRTVYLQENRVMGFQLVGDITAAGFSPV